MQISESAFNMIHHVQFQYPSGLAFWEISHISPHQCCQSCCRSKVKKKVWTTNGSNVLVLKKVEDSQRILIIIKGWMPKKYISWIGRYLKKKKRFLQGIFNTIKNPSSARCSKKLNNFQYSFTTRVSLSSMYFTQPVKKKISSDLFPAFH